MGLLYTSADVAVDHLDFDRDNPRLLGVVDVEHQTDVLRFMLDDAALVDLASSIAAQGFFPGEPILCCPNPELPAGTKPPEPTADSRYTVVEGNRRLAAVILLRNPQAAPSRKQAILELAGAGTPPDELPTILFPRRDDILDYLGYRHITGIKEWEPLAKARYLRQVRERKRAAHEPDDPRDLAKLIGSNGPYVGRLLTSLAAWDRLENRNFFSKHNLSVEDLPFAVFSTALNYEHIPEWLNVNPKDDSSVAQIADSNLERLAKWFFVPDDRVPKGRPLLRESRNIRYINEIVGDDEAMAALEDQASSPQLAASLTAEASQVFSEAVSETGKYIAVAVRRFPDVEHPEEQDGERLVTIRDQAEQLRVGIEDRLAKS